MSNKLFLVLSLLVHDGVAYEADSTVELTEDQATPLKALKVIVDKEQTPKNPPSTAPEGQVRIDAIKAAIAGLNVDVAENWAKDGKPKADVLSKVLGWPVAAAERDTVWAELHPAPAA